MSFKSLCAKFSLIGSLIVSTSFGGAIRFNVCSDKLVSGLPHGVEIPSKQNSEIKDKDMDSVYLGSQLIEDHPELFPGLAQEGIPYTNSVIANRAKFTLYELLLSADSSGSFVYGFFETEEQSKVTQQQRIDKLQKFSQIVDDYGLRIIKDESMPNCLKIQTSGLTYDIKEFVVKK